MEHVSFLIPTLILLLTGIAAIALTRPLKLNPIVGYLLAGLLIGPHGLDFIQESHTTHILAELGIVFLLFDIGLHFTLEDIWDSRREMLGLGPLQVLLCALVLAWPVYLLTDSGSLAILIGVALALSSTAVVAQVLASFHQRNSPVGSAATSVLIFQDIVAIFLLIMAAGFGQEGAPIGETMLLSLGKALAAFAVAVLVAKLIAEPLLRFIASFKNDEVFSATALLIVLAAAAATGMIELSLTLGAFLGGMIIAETHYRHIIQVEVKPFRGLLLGFFFITIGMQMDPRSLLSSWLEILLSVILLLGLKSILVFAACKLLRMPTRSSIQLGFLLSQGSEFAFVVFSYVAVQSALGIEITNVLITAVAISMALTPPLSALGHQLAERLSERHYDQDARSGVVSPRDDCTVLVINMGEVGHCIADALEAHDIPYIALDNDHDRFIQAKTDGYQVAFGDATDLRLISTLDSLHVKTVVNTMPHYATSEKLTRSVNDRFPGLKRFASVNDEDQVNAFASIGVTAVADNSLPPGLDLAAAVLKSEGIADEKVSNWLYRQHLRALEERDQFMGDLLEQDIK